MKRHRIVRCLAASVLGAAALTGLPALATPAAAADCFVQLGSGGVTIGQGVTDLAPCGQRTGVFSAFVELPHEECEQCTIRFMWVDQLGIKLDTEVKP